MRAQQWTVKLLHESRIGHMATSTKDGRPHTVPICYVFNGKTIYSSIDEKPKRVSSGRLRRARNITQNPRVCLVVDTYSEDWKKLRYVIVHGLATIISGGNEHKRAIALLRRKYRQYRKMHIEEHPVIRICPVRIIGWRSDLET